jgi:hypothetical protein
MGYNGISWDLPSGKRLQKTMERSTMLLMGKSTISTGPFSSSQFVSHYQRVVLKKPQGFVVLWIPHENFDTSHF